MKKVLLILLALVLLFIVGSLFYVNRMISAGMPVTSGEIDVPGLAREVTVLRDDNGIPHIRAADEADVYFAMGYVHAQDRLFQMDVIRRFAEGRFAEMVGDEPNPGGDYPTIYEQDVFSRVIGFHNMGREYELKVPEPGATAMRRYTDGVNAYIKQHEGKLSIEFFFLQHKMEPWTVADTIAVSRYVAWGLSANAEEEIMRYEAVSRLGREHGWELYPRHFDHGPYAVPPSQRKYDPKGKIIEDRPVPLPAELLNPDFFGALGERLKDIRAASYGFGPAASNNWVISGKLTKSGKPILANDPHLYHMLPSVFYIAHLVTDDGLDVAGVTFPGIPFVVLGHNRNIAWGCTTTRTDVQDLYVEKTDEKNHPGRYLYNGKWEEFKTRKEEILVRNKEEKEIRTITVRISRHGPVLNDMLGERYKKMPPVALKWAAFDPSDDAGALMLMARAKNLGDIKKALSRMGAPIQSWVFVDRDGNIGFLPAGMTPIRKKGDGTMPVPGWTDEYEWTGYIPMDELPQLYNPAEGFIITANNQIVPEEDYPYHYSYYYMMYRAERIRQLIEGGRAFTVDDIKKFQMDHKNLQAARLRDRFVAAWRKEGNRKNAAAARAVKRLAEWNLENDVDSVGATIFERAYYEARRLTLADDISKPMFDDQLKQWKSESAFDLGVETGNFSFFDDKATKKVETRDAILARSVADAVRELTKKYGADQSQWKWGKYHVLNTMHVFSGVKPLNMIFGYENVPLAGNTHTVDAESYTLSPDMLLTNGGPAMRHIVDMANPETSQIALDSGQSGHPKSKHYTDLLKLYLEGKYVPLWMDDDDIRVNLEGELTLKPAKK